jgi:hypothetical protein
MPERTEQQTPKPDLGQRVEEVLEAIDATCADLQRQSRSTQENEIAELEKLTDQAIGDDGEPISVPETESTPAAETEPPELSEPDDDSLGEDHPPELEQIEEPIDQQPDAVVVDQSEPAAQEEPEPAPEIIQAPESLDDGSDDIGLELDDMLTAMNEVVETMDAQIEPTETDSTPATDSTPIDAAQPDPVPEPESFEPVAEITDEAATDSHLEPEPVDEPEDAQPDPAGVESEPVAVTPEESDSEPETNDSVVEDDTQAADDTEQLDESLDAQLEDLTEELGDIAAELGDLSDENSIEEPQEQADTVGEIDPPLEIDDLVESDESPADAQAQLPDDQVESAESEVPGSDAETTAEDIESILTDAVEAATDETDAVEEDTESQAEANIEQLDEELAGLAEELVDGDFEDATGEVAEAVEIPELSADAESDPLGDTAPIEEPTESGVEPVAQDKSETDSDDDDTPSGGSVAEPKAPDRPTWHKVRDAALAFARSGAKAAVPIGARVLLLVAKPTSKLPASTRDTVGWLGLYTAFLAVCVWGFLLFFRKPIMPVPTAEPVGISGEVIADELPAED